MLSQQCLEIKEQLESGNELTVAQEAFVMRADQAMDDWWYTLLHNERQLDDWFEEPFRTEIRAAASVIKRGWNELSRISQGV